MRTAVALQLVHVFAITDATLVSGLQVPSRASLATLPSCWLQLWQVCTGDADKWVNNNCVIQTELQRFHVQYGTDDIEVDSSSLWFAGKQMVAENKLKAHVGRHEKTKAVVKLQKKGQGAPAREPVRCQSVLIAVPPRCCTCLSMA